MQPCKYFRVFIFQWQKPALACEAANVAKLVHALVLWHITCTKGVSSQKEPKGCTCQRTGICGSSTQPGNMREILNPPARELVFCRDCLALSYYLRLDPKGHLNGRLLSRSLAMFLSLAKDQEILILSSQLWGEKNPPHQKNPPQWKKNHNMKRREAKQLAKGKPFKGETTKQECQTAVWN